MRYAADQFGDCSRILLDENWIEIGIKNESPIFESRIETGCWVFDLEGATTTDVIASVSSDSLVIQDVLSEKASLSSYMLYRNCVWKFVSLSSMRSQVFHPTFVREHPSKEWLIILQIPYFIMNCTTIFSSSVVGFILVWRLALVVFPTAMLLILPRIMYGRMLMGIGRKKQRRIQWGWCYCRASHFIHLHCLLICGGAQDHIRILCGHGRVHQIRPPSGHLLPGTRVAWSWTMMLRAVMSSQLELPSWSPTCKPFFLNKPLFQC